MERNTVLILAYVFGQEVFVINFAITIRILLVLRRLYFVARIGMRRAHADKRGSFNGDYFAGIKGMSFFLRPKDE